MKTQAIHLDMDELGLMSNLLFVAMESSGRAFKDQPMQVKLLSTKIAKAYQTLEEAKPKKLTEVTDMGSFKITTVSRAVQKPHE